MRLYDTYSQLAGRAAAAAGPGADVLLRPDGLRARARRQRAAVRARDVAALVAARDGLRGDARPQHHRRERQDLRRRARARARELAEQATAWYLEDTGGLGLGMPDHAAEGDRAHPRRSSRFIEELVESGTPTRSTATSTSASRASRSTGGSRGSGPTRSRSRSRTRSRRTRATSPSGRRTSRARTRSWDSPWGQGRPGWHIECSAMAEELLGEAFEIHGGGLDLVFPHHENELAQSRALGHAFAHVWAHNGLLQFTGEKMSKSVGNIATIREVLDRWGRETLLVFFLARPLAQADRLLRRDDGAGAAQAETLPQRLSRLQMPAPEADAGSAFAAALDDDFNTPAALAVMHELARTTSCCAGRSRSSASTRSRSRSGAAGGRRARRARAGRAGRARLRDGRPRCAPRSRRRAGRCATSPAATRSSRGGDRRPRLRPARRARGAARPPRGARAVGDRARARGRAVARRGEGRSCGPSAS